MRYVQHSIRLPLTLDKTLRHVAQCRQVTTYKLLQQCVQLGIVSFSGEEAVPKLAAEMAHELGALSARLVHLEQLAERGLYVSCAAYAYARAAAGTTDETKLVSEIKAAFDRQLNLIGDI